MEMDIEFIEETNVSERALRRLAASKGVTARRIDGHWSYEGLSLDDDEFWALCSAL